MYRLARVLAVAPLLAGCIGVADDTNDPPVETPDTTDPACQILSEGERVPGYPYNLDSFANVVLPTLVDNCSSAGCHAPPEGLGGYTVWPEAAIGNCDYAKTFNAFAAFVDLKVPGNSRVLSAVNGALATHPIKYEPGDAQLEALNAYVNDASVTFNAGGGGGQVPPPGASPFNYDVYQQTIAPMLDSAEGIGCSSVGCHGSGAGNFALSPNPDIGSQEMVDNFLTVTSRMSLQSPANSLMYLKSTTIHAAGASNVLSLQQAGDMLAWIEDASANNGGQDPIGCASPDLFNLGVFRDEIFPVLTGDLDLNNPGAGRTTGCVRGPCHGTDRGPGTLFLNEQAAPEQNLQNFACFVDLNSPSRSQIMTCPSGICADGSPHPGQDVFQGADDLNYKRVLSYLYGSNVGRQPLDYAFFVRQINPIFNDLQAVENGAQGRTCADATSCHGISIAGQPASNGSNFPLFPNVADDARLSFNFVSAAGFVNFLDPDQSSLFLYPTNEIANRDNPLATGLPHAGGLDFAVDDIEALTILKWAAGLRPDNDGFITDWLVGGDYPASQITDITAIDEVNATPRIFDPTGVAQFNNGEWDGLFQVDPDDVTVDLNRAFPREPTGRIAYAVAYLTNTSALDINAQLEIVSPNAVRVYVGNQLVAQANNAENGVIAIANLPSYIANANGSTRVLIKLFQRADDEEFEFTARARDEFGNILTNITGELVLQLGPGGGI